MPPAGGRVRTAITKDTPVVAGVGCEATDPATPRFLLRKALPIEGRGLTPLLIS